MPMPKIKMPSFPRPTVYKRQSPLTPPKEGYPIILGQGMGMKDLEPELTIVHKKGGEMRYVETRNPYLSLGATQAIREQNLGKEAEIEKVAVDLEHQWNRPFKAPTTPYKPILNPDAKDATFDEQAEALSNAELERKSKEEEQNSFDTMMSNERTASDPSGDPLWIQRSPGQGPKKNFK
jgi:hypothetical protein